MTSTTLTAADLQFLQSAAQYLERPGFLMRIANLVGKPAEGLLSALPKRAHALVGDMTHSALSRALAWAVRTLPGERSSALARVAPSGPRLHLALTAATGAVGGLFGLAGAAVEIPATTTLMLRSIAEIAAASGADLNDPRTRLECLCVFSYGAPDLKSMESAYFSSRLGLALAMRDAAAYLTRHGVQEIAGVVAREAAPALVRLVNQIAVRFEVLVSEKMAAQAVPVAGAAMGSLINAAFTDHFNRVAEYHFGIVRLERKYGAEAVQAAYRQAVVQVREAGG